MSSKLSQLCDQYQAIVFFDTETTGLDPSVDQIIELAAVQTDHQGTRHDRSVWHRHFHCRHDGSRP